MTKEKKKTNWILTIVLVLGTVTVFFPLYMAVIIAFKQVIVTSTTMAEPHKK